MGTSGSGGTIFRYEPKDRDNEPASADRAGIERIARHVERHIGPIDEVFHESHSDLVHITSTS